MCRTRTRSTSSSRSRRSSHTLTAPSTSSSSFNRKDLYSNPDSARSSGGEVEKANISMPAPSSKLNSNPRSSYQPQSQRRPSSSYSRHSSINTSDHNRKYSDISILSRHLRASMAASNLHDSSAIDDDLSTESSSTLEPKSLGNVSPTTSLPDSALQVPRQDNDSDQNRSSFSSLYQIGSALYDRARGAMASGPSSVAGSEPDSTSWSPSHTCLSSHLTRTSQLKHWVQRLQPRMRP